MLKELPLPEIDLPDEGITFFYRLTKWYEENKKTSLIKWGQKQGFLKKLKFLKPGKGERLEVPKQLSQNTLYFPYQNFGAKNIIENIRHAFCHNGICFDKLSKQYIIRSTGNIHLDASFTLEALQELSIFFPNPNKEHRHIKKEKRE